MLMFVQGIMQYHIWENHWIEPWPGRRWRLILIGDVNNKVIVINMPWSGFVVQTFFKNFVPVTQRAFRTRFVLNSNERVPNQKTIFKWVQNWRPIGPANPVGCPKSVRTPETIAKLRASIEQSPTCSARKHASALELVLELYKKSRRPFMRKSPEFLRICWWESPYVHSWWRETFGHHF